MGRSRLLQINPLPSTGSVDFRFQNYWLFVTAPRLSQSPSALYNTIGSADMQSRCGESLVDAYVCIVKSMIECASDVGTRAGSAHGIESEPLCIVPLPCSQDSLDYH